MDAILLKSKRPTDWSDDDLDAMITLLGDESSGWAQLHAEKLWDERNRRLSLDPMSRILNEIARLLWHDVEVERLVGPVLSLVREDREGPGTIHTRYMPVLYEFLETHGAWPNATRGDECWDRFFAIYEMIWHTYQQIR